MNNLLQLLLALVIAVLIGVLAAPYFIDWNQYRSEIETQASKIIGHKLVISGNIHLRLLPAPYLQLEQITVKAPAKEGGQPASPPPPDLLKARAFKLWLAAPPLLRGVVEVLDMEIIQPHLLFAIDENGKSNWSREHNSAMALPFTPRAISLQSMTIRKGRLEISSRYSDPKGSKDRKFVLTDLEGDFSAGSLKGPYKFEGTTGRGADRQILRLATGRIDEKQQMRIKGVLRSAVKRQRHAFDGSVSRLNKHPVLEGVLTSAFPFFQTVPKAGGKEDGGRIKPIEVKTAVHADANGALFDKILVTIVHNNRPQMMTGRGKLSWSGGEIALDGNLKARLIDIDQLKDGLKMGDSVRQTMGELFAGLQRQSDRIDSGRFSIRMDQIKLNGDLVQNLVVSLEKDRQNLQVREFSANLPGDNAIRLSGAFAGQAGQPRFEGSGFIRGQSLGHFVTWTAGTRSRGNVNAIRSHPFTLRGDLVFSRNFWSLQNVLGDISGTSFTGDISHRSSPPSIGEKSGQAARGEISLRLTTAEIDSAAFMGRPVAMREIIESLLRTGAKQKAGSPSKGRPGSEFASLVRDNSIKLQLRAGRILLEDFDGRDLLVDIYYGKERLQINGFSLRSQNGLHLQADGTIRNIETTPGGSLTATINIENGAELKQFVSWLTPTGASPFTARQIRSLLPLRLALMLQTGKSSASEAKLGINGIAGSSHIAFNNRILGKNLFSRQVQRQIEQMEFSGTFDNRDGRVLLAQIIPHFAVEKTQLRETGPGKIWISAAGLPDVGLNSRLEFNSSRITAGFDGLLGWKNGQGYYQGTARLKAGDIASGLAVFGIDMRNAGSSGILDLSAMLDKKGDKYVMSNIRGTIASSGVEGRATLQTTKQGASLDLALLAGSLDFPALFSPLLAAPQDSREEPAHGNNDIATATRLAGAIGNELQNTQSLQQAVITNRQFRADMLRNLTARIVLTADRMRLADRIFLNKADMSIQIRDRQISIGNLDGDFWGGRLHGAGKLDLSATLARVSGSLKIARASLGASPLSVDKTPVLTGDMNLKMQFEGQGLSPAGLFSLLNGKGRIDIRKGRINHLSSSVLNDIVEDELAVWKQSEDQTGFKERFRRHLVHGAFDLGSTGQTFTIKDGTLQLKATHLSRDRSKLELDANLMLAAMNTHTRLVLSPLPEAKYPDLPAVQILIEGPLADLDAIKPRINTASLEQFLNVMKMEHDVELLEKLHRRDEEFARRAAQRRAQEKQRLEEMETERQLQNQTDAATAAPREKRDSWVPFNQNPGPQP